MMNVEIFDVGIRLHHDAAVAHELPGEFWPNHTFMLVYGHVYSCMISWWGEGVLSRGGESCLGSLSPLGGVPLGGIPLEDVPEVAYSALAAYFVWKELYWCLKCSAHVEDSVWTLRHISIQCWTVSCRETSHLIF
jgi:hypothetical protein